MTNHDVRALLEEAAARVPPRDLADAAWAEARRRQAGRRAIFAALVTAVTVGIAVVAVTETQGGHGPAPADHRPSPDKDNDRAGEGAVRSPSPLEPGMVQPFWEPDAVESLEPLPTDLPALLDSTAPAELSADPVSQALAAIAYPGGEDTTAIYVLGEDGDWRSIDVTGLTEASDPFGPLSRGSVSADGTQLALAQRGGIVVVDLTTGAFDTFDVPGSYAPVTWHPDGRHVAVGMLRGGTTLVDTASGDRIELPYPTYSSTDVAFAPDGSVVENYWSRRHGHELRWYEGADLVDRLSAGSVLGALRSVSVGESGIAAVRGVLGWSGSSREPWERDGLMVVSRTGEPLALLPVRDPDSFYSESVETLGWFDHETLLVRYTEKPAYRAGVTSFTDEPDHLIAWNYVTGDLRWVADVARDRELALAPAVIAAP